MDDMDKQFMMYGAIAAGWVVILYHVAFNGLIWGHFTIAGLFISLFLAAAVGAGVFFGMKKSQG